MAEKKLSISERFELLEEAEQFFADLSAAGEVNENLGLHKAMGLGTVKDCMYLFQDILYKGKEWTEEMVEQGLLVSVNEELVKDIEEYGEMTDEEKDFYEGGFGMAIGILKGDEDILKELADLQAEYDVILELKAGQKTIADLVK